MKKFLALVAVAALVLGVGSVAYANYCATDVVPAATILYPFVQYNYTDPNTTTLFSVTNVSSTAVIVHFTLWTDYSAGVVDWNVVLSGYDVQTFNIRDILGNYVTNQPGQLPSTGTGSNPNFGSRGEIGVDYEEATDQQTDGVGPVPHKINDSQNTGNLSDLCNMNFDGYPNFPAFPQQFMNFMKGLLTSSQTVTRVHMDCNGLDVVYGDWFEKRDLTAPTWMYITADVVYSCNQMFPATDQNYWHDATQLTKHPDTSTTSKAAAVASGPQLLFDNVLIGDIYYINTEQNYSEAINAVSLEAQSGTNLHTFYEQYSSKQDGREPLPTGWAFRYMNAPDAVGSTQIRVFKRATSQGNFIGVHDLISDADQQDAPTFLEADDTIPYSLYFWDENEEPVLWTRLIWPWSPGPKFCRINLFPLETQQVDISEFHIPFPTGWALLVYPPSNGASIVGQTPGASADNYQVYVSTRQSANIGPHNFSAVLQGAVIYNANCNPDDIMP